MVATQLNDDIGAQARFNMVECQVKPGGVRDYRLTLHLGRLPREAFVSSDVRDLAYASRSNASLGRPAERYLPPQLSRGWPN
jgi:protein-L-isoaspartate O-methyltransferase